MTTITVNPDGGADYTSLSAAIAAIPTTLDDDYTVECSSGGTADTTAVACPTFTLGGFTVTIAAASGHEAKMPWDATRYRLEISAAGSAIALTNGVTLKSVQVRNTSTAVGSHAVYQGYGSVCDGVFARIADSQGGHPFYGDNTYSPGSSYTRRDCIGWVGGTTQNSTAVFHTSGTHNAYHDNCTAIGGKYGFFGDRNTHQVRNCVAYGNTTGFTNAAGWTSESDYNASQDGTAPGASSITLTADPFVDSAGGDYHRSDSGQLAGVGENLSASFTTDFDGLTWGSTWDIGATSTETGSAGGGSLSGDLSDTMLHSEDIGTVFTIDDGPDIMKFSDVLSGVIKDNVAASDIMLFSDTLGAIYPADLKALSDVMLHSDDLGSSYAFFLENLADIMIFSDQAGYIRDNAGRPIDVTDITDLTEMT